MKKTNETLGRAVPRGKKRGCLCKDGKTYSRKYGMDLPIGTWMVSMKVNNDEVWNDYVKTGLVKGFSIEDILKIN